MRFTWVSNISLILLACTLQSLINIPGKADATFCASLVFFYTRGNNTWLFNLRWCYTCVWSILINYEAAKQICQATIAQCFEAWYAAHLTTCITQSSRLCYNDIFKVLKCSCSDRDRFQRKNTLISRTVGSVKVCLKYAGFTFTHSSCGDGTFFEVGVPTPPC